MKRFIVLIALFILAAGMAHAIGFEASWDANTEEDLAGYKLYYGTSPGVYGTVLNVGTATAVQVDALLPGAKYYVAVSAYDTSGNESLKSDEESIVLVVAPPPDTTPPVKPKNLRLTIWQQISWFWNHWLFARSGPHLKVIGG